ncbi:NAD(P)/FAD-dependent oxidoreductase [Ostreiculturibacter nitratireducens]|uniref:flavin-containing monooxygenase n=1 Tax=Ostreiculturibacter nitratireducens TaxID=3075226 RepID=UPI0031B62348
MTMRTDVAIIGGGQAGLAMSRCLTDRGIDHVILERGRVGERWISERWPSLRLLTPNWMTRLPGHAYAGSDPDGFMASAEFVDVLSGYAQSFDAPVVEGAEVYSLSRIGSRFLISTSKGTWAARAAVIATGACDRPNVPDWAGELPDGVLQITPDRYRGADDLPSGGVLVVGSSATGIQFAEEISTSGRSVVLAAGRHVRAPRRYRGRDIFHWLDASGFLTDRRPPDADPRHLQSQPSLQLIGTEDGHDIDLHRLAARGVRVVGRALGATGRLVHLSDELAEECAAAEARRQKLLTRIDAHIRTSGRPVAEEPSAWTAPPPFAGTPTTLDLRANGIETIVWATGYRRRYPWLNLPVFRDDGEIRNHGGVTPVEGLYVLGLPFMRHRSSAFIDGVGQDAAALSRDILRQLSTPTAIAA